MNKHQHIVGIVLSGGKSSRMGTEKGLVQWKGKALIEYAIDCLQPLCNEIVISTNGNEYDHLHYPVVADIQKDCGPLGGIYSCMKSYKADLYLVISCDVPNVPTALFVDLIRNIDSYDLILACDQEVRKHPLIAVYRPACLPIIERELMEKHFKMMRLLDLIHHTYFEVEPQLNYYNPNLLSNFNTPSDLSSI